MSNKRKRIALIAQDNLESDIFMSSTRLSDRVLQATNQLLKVWGMTALQYNALKVIYRKDPQDEGLPSGEIGKGLYTRVPDVTRLLDRLAEKGWVSRQRDAENRRVVRTRLTQIGIELVESAHAPLLELEHEQFDHLSDDEKAQLAGLLKKALNKP